MTKNDPKKSTHIRDIVILFSIPVIVACIAAAVVYIPQFFAHPKYDFIYSVCEKYSCRDTYVINSMGQIAEPEELVDKLPTLYYYDVEKNRARSITLQEAGLYSIDTHFASPDGYKLVKDEERRGLYTSSDRWYLKNGMLRKNVDIIPFNNRLNNKLDFLGWAERRDE